MRHWFDAMNGLGLEHGSSFDLDFHTIPFHGEDALVEKHYVSKRSRLRARPRGAWRQITLDNVSRIYKTPRILDEQVSLTDYTGPIRQIAIMDLGHEEPTLLLTNQLQRSAAKLIGRYARRMLIENNIEDDEPTAWC